MALPPSIASTKPPSGMREFHPIRSHFQTRLRWLVLLLEPLLFACTESSDHKDVISFQDFGDAKIEDLSSDGMKTEDLVPDSQGACLLGSAFVACPGSYEPKIRCSDTRCKWVSNGAPVADLLYAADTSCNCANDSCLNNRVIQRFIYERGVTPWKRDRSLDVQVKVDKTIGSSSTTITCTNCVGACSSGDNPCNAHPPGVILREDPGTIVFLLGVLGGLHGWQLEVEVDFGFTPPRARVCTIPFSDAISCAPGLYLTCATAGTIALSSAETPSAAGTFDVQFTDGLTIKGTFPAK